MIYRMMLFHAASFFMCVCSSHIISRFFCGFFLGVFVILSIVSRSKRVDYTSFISTTNLKKRVLRILNDVGFMIICQILRNVHVNVSQISRVLSLSVLDII